MHVTPKKKKIKNDKLESERLKKIETSYSTLKLENDILKTENEKLKQKISDLTSDKKYLKEYIKELEKSKDKKCIKTPKYKKQKIPKNIRNIVWDTHMGADFKRGLCCCCKVEPITFVNFHCGHIESECDGFLSYDRTIKFNDADTKAIAAANQAIIIAAADPHTIN